MSEICKNCNYEVALQFCPNCGQRKMKRIDRTYLKDELQYTVLHMNKGFFYSLKKILKAPGQTAREFLEGSRVNHYKPILMVVVVTGISTFLTTTFLDPGEAVAKYYQAHDIKTGFDIKTFQSEMMKYMSIIMLLTIPFMSVFTWLVFRKWGDNYYENIISNAYFLVLWLVLSVFIVFPVQLLLKHDFELYVWVSSLLSYALGFGLLFWFFIGFYNQKSAGEVVIKVFYLIISLFVSFVVLSVGAGIIMGIYMAINGVHPSEVFPASNM